MNKETAIDKSIKEEKVETWSNTIKKGNWTKRIDVEKLYNKGYLITLNIYGEDKKGKYKDTTRKMYSETNPLEEEVSDPMENLFKMLNRNK